GGSLESSTTMMSDTRSSMSAIDARHLRSEPARLRVAIPTLRRGLDSADMLSRRDGLSIHLERALGRAGPGHSAHLIEGDIRAAVREIAIRQHPLQCCRERSGIARWNGQTGSLVADERGGTSR